MKKFKLNLKKISKIVGIVLFVAMLVFIYMVSPQITATIQNMAKFIYEIDENYITRVVELLLSVSLVLAAVSTSNLKSSKK